VTNACGQCGPTPVEVCDGIDNDCNGSVDDGAVCPPGEMCLHGGCRLPCPTVELASCAPGTVCQDAYCVPTACSGVTCPTGQTCDADAGACTDPCANVTCKSAESCKQGVCVPSDCYQEACPSGMICTAGSCQDDPCTGKLCGIGEFCRQGGCVKSCSGVVCAAGQQCVDGACAAEGCSQSCAAGQICHQGMCSADPCVGMVCGSGRVCQAGSCVDDPCRGVHCPGATDVCSAGQCVTPSADVHDAADAGKSGVDAGVGPTSQKATTGCGCSSGAELQWAGALLLLALARRRSAAH
jgi:hypothetical protein